MNKRPNGIDTNAITLDSDGRFELDEPQMAKISGGMRKRGIIIIRGGKCKRETGVSCPSGTIEVIRGTHCVCM